MDTHIPVSPQDYWQEFYAPGTFDTNPGEGFSDFYPASFPNGDQIALPIRVLSGGQNAIASLIVNQASFAVLDRFSSELVDLAQPFTPEIVVGMPTLGLGLAADVARKLGHSRFVALSTSRKFWYEDRLSVPLISITSPTQQKQLYMDPRMLSLLVGRRILLIDDVLSSGASILAGISLLQKCDLMPTAIGAAMLQTERWATLLASNGLSSDVVKGVIHTPLLERSPAGRWRAA